MRSRARPWWRESIGGSPGYYEGHVCGAGACLEDGACLKRAGHHLLTFGTPHTTAEDWARAIVVDPNASTYDAFDAPVEQVVCQTIVDERPKYVLTNRIVGYELADTSKPFAGFDFDAYNGTKP